MQLSNSYLISFQKKSQTIVIQLIFLSDGLCPAIGSVTIQLKARIDSLTTCCAVKFPSPILTRMYVQFFVTSFKKGIINSTFVLKWGRKNAFSLKHKNEATYILKSDPRSKFCNANKRVKYVDTNT